jgi:uncharacterized protein (TIGR02284 family)
MAEKEPREIIQDLIESCRDGETGYLHAAGVADDAQLKSYFQAQSTERARFRMELTELIEGMGVDNPDTSGSTAAVLLRAWFELKDDFGGGDHTLLESVEQGEDSAKERYEEALNSSLPPNIQAVVRRQYTSLKAAHDRVRDLRDKKAA